MNPRAHIDRNGPSPATSFAPIPPAGRMINWRPDPPEKKKKFRCNISSFPWKPERMAFEIKSSVAVGRTGAKGGGADPWRTIDFATAFRYDRHQIPAVFNRLFAILWPGSGAEDVGRNLNCVAHPSTMCAPSAWMQTLRQLVPMITE